MTVLSKISFHGIRNITASTFDELDSAPLNIELEGADWQRGSAGLTIHTHDRELTAAIVAAINSAVSAIKAKREATALPSYDEALKDPAKARELFDASKGGNVRGITEDHRYALAEVIWAAA